MNPLRAAQGCYLALIGLQVAWHGLLPSPHGADSWALAGLAAAPLLLPVKGVLGGSVRSLTWAGYLAMLYLVIGVTEAWANPPQRVPALLQIGLVAGFVAGTLVFSRRLPRRQ